ncbi:hypothetical protein [Kitasatospora sp. KL5]|uniref:hypothetical protein n=1 Tax=Kitasatospora sp. KL5 TaxID=3425125 RepID=UPI003D6EE100
MQQEWPEGPAADPEAARERYAHDLQEARRDLREAVRPDFFGANIGLGLVALAAVAVGYVKGPVVGAAVPAAFAVLFLVVAAITAACGVRGAKLLRRSYLLTFGWGDWI